MSKVSMPGKIFGTVLSHGMKGRMLTKNELQTLAEARDIEELVTRMKNTVYLDALSKLTKPYTAEKIEGALRENLVNNHVKMVSIAGGSGVLNAYFVKYITWNLKLILKGKALGKSYDELVPKINLRAEELVGRRDTVVKALVAKSTSGAQAAREQVVRDLTISYLQSAIKSASQIDAALAVGRTECGGERIGRTRARLLSLRTLSGKPGQRLAPECAVLFLNVGARLVELFGLVGNLGELLLQHARHGVDEDLRRGLRCRHLHADHRIDDVRHEGNRKLHE